MKIEFKSALAERIALGLADPISDVEKAIVAKLRAEYEKRYGTKKRTSMKKYSVVAENGMTLAVVYGNHYELITESWLEGRLLKIAQADLTFATILVPRGATAFQRENTMYAPSVKIGDGNVDE